MSGVGVALVVVTAGMVSSLAFAVADVWASPEVATPAREQYEPLARQAARGAQIDETLFVRQIARESAWDAGIIECKRGSSAGAEGIAQILRRFHPLVNPCDPAAALRYSATLMSRYLGEHGGSWRLALAAYNAGPGAVAKYGGVPPFPETHRYIADILGAVAQAPTPDRFEQ